MANAHVGHGAHDHAPGEHDAGHHIIEPPTYYKVFGILMILLIVTLAAAAIDLGPLNLPIAMLIAIVKAGVVMAYFMHLKFNSALVRLFAFAGVAWLMILFHLTLNDYVSRPWLQTPGQ